MNNSKDFQYLFVYGSLRKGSGSAMAEWLEHQAEWHEQGYIRGLLFNIGEYPGAITSPNFADKVWGDVYRLENSEYKRLLNTLDEFEECTYRYATPHEYRRVKLPVFLPKGQTVNAWCYFYNRPTERLKRIASGDYVAFKSGASGLIAPGSIN